MRCTSIHNVITVSTVHNVFCQPLISSKKCPMNFDVIMFCSWTYNSTSYISNRTSSTKHYDLVLLKGFY